MGWESNAHLPLCTTCSKGLALTFDGKKSNIVGCNIQYWMTFAPSCTCPLNQMKAFKPSSFVIKTRSLKVSPNICSMIYGLDTFWPIIFQVGTWINSQSIIVVPPCCAYPKKIIPWIKVKTPMMDLTIPCGYCVSYCRLVDGAALMSATFKPKHTNINWASTWGIEMLVFFGNKRVSRSTDWLVNVEIHNNSYKTLYAHGWNEEMRVYKK